MPNLIIPVIHRPQRSPSQRFRFEQYIGFLEKNGWTVTISYIVSESDDAFFYKSGYFLRKFFILIKGILIRFKDVYSIRNYDVVLVQRESFMLGTALFERLFKLFGAKLIFDFDDAIWTSEKKKLINIYKNLVFKIHCKFIGAIFLCIYRYKVISAVC